MVFFWSVTGNRRDIVELGPENPWRPCPEWEDSRHKYPMGTLFPKPFGGWTNSQEQDFKQAVKDHFKPLPSNEHDLASLQNRMWTDKHRTFLIFRINS